MPHWILRRRLKPCQTKSNLRTNSFYSQLQNESKGASKNLGRGNVTTKPKKNTVASLLAQTRGVPSNDRLSDTSLASSHPELTIEPIYRSATAESSAGADHEFDQSHNGRRMSTYVDSEGRLQIKNTSESPEIRNSSERDSEEGQGSDSEADFHEDGISQLSSKDASNTSMFAFLLLAFSGQIWATEPLWQHFHPVSRALIPDTCTGSQAAGWKYQIHATDRCPDSWSCRL